MVSFIALYYFFIEWVFDGVYHIRILSGKTANLIDIVTDLVLGMFIHHNFNITWGLLVIDEIQEYLVGSFVCSAFLAYLTCNIQCFMGLRSIKYDLIKFYKGDHADIKKLEKNTKIIQGDLHFTGFLVLDQRFRDNFRFSIHS